MNVSLDSPDQPDVIALIAELDAYQDGLYPAESRYALDLASLKQPNVRFAVARDGAGVAIGCGAMMLEPAFGELKRMFVAPAYRGLGVAGRILSLLEEAAGQAGCKVFMLETGPYQPDALGFYTRSGYRQRGPYADYPDDPLSVFMEKHAS